MKEGKRNILGDLIMSITIGCATFLAFILLCALMWGTFMIFATYLKPEN